MRTRDTFDVGVGVIAALVDALAVFAAFMLATWIRFDSGWIPVLFGRPPALYAFYAKGAVVATLGFLFVFRTLELYTRPQLGRFETKIPRLVRACFIGVVLTMVLSSMFKNFVAYATAVQLIAFVTVPLLVLIERYASFRVELHFYKHSARSNRVLLLGTDQVAAHLLHSLSREPRLRSEIVGFLRTDLETPHEDIPADRILGTSSELDCYAGPDASVDQVILTNSNLGHERIVDIILFCERNMIQFNMVPDLFRVLTGGMDVQNIDDIPLLGVSQWPLDLFWNRLLKRTEDVCGALVGLLISTPVVVAAGLAVKRQSPGPMFYRQERCGEQGRMFKLVKLRTMRTDAEADSGPVFTAENDERILPAGRFLRRHNLDELPQLWNVLRGDMSLVGPRPERPHFVDQFKEDISRYMWRHVSKPGMTGWAQVNGLRGNTSIEERIKYDLFYLENWSLSFDFKILAKTVFARENAY